ncbi:MAG: hypothetical protein ABIW49_04525 [Knoellia sp.]
MSLSGSSAAVKGLLALRLLAQSVGRSAAGDAGLRKKSDVAAGLRKMSEDVARA